MSKKIQVDKIAVPGLSLLVIFSISAAPALASESSESSHFIWIIGEISLAVITAVILLALYSWHLRTVVSKKTRELKRLNAHLEDKVEERTSELKKMYAHAERERKRTKVALESEREAIQQNLHFMDMISHEYRTPLSVISSSIELIRRKCELDDFRQIDGQIKKMTISTQRLIDIFDSALGKDRLDTLAAQLQKEPLNLIVIINAAIQLIRTVYEEHEIIFKRPPYEEVGITGDEKLLVTVFKNILDNACKYSDPDEPVYIRLTADQDRVEAEIIDSGMGIDEDEIGSVFKKYYRSEHTGKRQGAGLGLFLVKTIVDLHKGEVSLTSQRNTGTKLSICLPR